MARLGRLTVLAVALGASLSSAIAQTVEQLQAPSPESWPSYGRTPEMTRFSPLSQVDRETVADLRLVWSRDLGFAPSATVQMSPIVFDGVLYVHSPEHVLALDAASGGVLWEYRPRLDPVTPAFFTGRSRGGLVAFDGRIYYSRADGVVAALDAATGHEVWTAPVGDILLAEGFTSGAIFAEGLIVVGPSGADLGGNNGRVVALDARSGAVAWTFDTVPKPGQDGFSTWSPPESARWGGGAAWTPGAYDPVTRTVIYGVGQPTPWFRPGFRRGSRDLYTASWVGLDVDSGALKWFFQVVPADEWDYDQVNTPIVVDLERDGVVRRAALLATTTGHLTLVDAGSGAFLGSHAMVPETTVHRGYEADGTPIIDGSMRIEASGREVLLCPYRWVNWEPAAYSPDTGLYYRPNTFDCQLYTLYTLAEVWQPGTPPLRFALQALPDRFDRLGALSAIDPRSGEVVWEFSHGYPQRASPVATAGSLVFSGFPDRVFRAFDAATGEVLWEQVLSAAVEAAAISYAVDGRQYIAVAAGAVAATAGQTGLAPTVPGPAQLFVFALP